MSGVCRHGPPNRLIKLGLSFSTSLKLCAALYEKRQGLTWKIPVVICARHKRASLLITATRQEPDRDSESPCFRCSRTWQLTGLCLSIRTMKVPQPFPYQGSKRNLASAILGYFPEGVATLVEPFAGSAAITLAAAAANHAENFIINDLNQPLIDVWRRIINAPVKLAQQYESLWRTQHTNRRKFYDEVRDQFNQTGKPHHLLYLLARCVKASVRYNANGEFNQ